MALHASPDSSRPATMRVAIECDLTKVRQAASQMKSFLFDQGFGARDVDAFELATVEACNNAIKYAAGEGRCKEVGLEVMVDKTQLEIRVVDHTKGFEMPEEVELPPLEQETGRGLFLIDSIMDDVQYLRGRGENCLIMRKTRPAAPEVAAGAVISAEEAQRRLDESERIIRDMAEELSSCYESLSAIFRCSSELGRTHDIEEFARLLLADLNQITNADWYVLRLAPVSGSELKVCASSHPGPLDEKIALNRIGGSAELQAAKAREDVWFDSHRPLREGDPLYNGNPKVHGLVHPIFLGDNLIGTLAVGKNDAAVGFTAVHANVVHTFSDFLAIQIVNARFNEEQVRTRLVSRELEIAHAIQESLLPKTLPKLPGLALAGFCRSAQQVGGDFYDVLKVRDDAALLIIADVMGKGVPAAMFAAILRSLVRAVPEWVDQPAMLLGRVNRLMYEELSAVDMFITAQLVFVDAANRKVTCASAGHCPGLLTANSRGEVLSLAPDGLPLGIEPNAEYSSETVAFDRPCRFLLYTDGLTEARNPHGEFFGQDRLLKWVRKTSQREATADELAADLADYISGFQSGAKQTDDQTFLIMAE